MFPAPIPDSYWLIPGRLCAGEYPGAKAEREARDKVRRFLDAGITHFVDLTEAGELAPYSGLVEELSAGSATHARMPIEDLSTPSREEMVRILDAIDAALDAGRSVYFHCWGGIGRTGTVAGCWLVRHGMGPEEALGEIERLRHPTPDGWKPSPETQQQRAMVLGWEQPPSTPGGVRQRPGSAA